MSEPTSPIESQGSHARSRRNFLTAAGMAGAAALGSGVLGVHEKEADALVVSAPFAVASFGQPGHQIEVLAIDILNFALNLEYLEAEYYLRATTGSGLAASDTTGGGSPGSYNRPSSTTPGTVTGGSAVPFAVPAIQQYAQQIAAHEQEHVQLLRAALGKDAVARPTIDLQTSFTNAAIAAGVIAAGQTFDPFANDYNFLLGAFIFEDVGVTAYHGGAPFIHPPAYVTAAAGILGTEAYHAGTVRTALFQASQSNPSLATIANQISALRASADGSGGAGHDAPLTVGGVLQVAPVDANGITYARTFQEVLNIVYLGGAAAGYGFFPNRMNGRIY